MKNEEFDDYYPTVLAAAMINVGFIEFKIAAVNDKTVGDSGAKMGLIKQHLSKMLKLLLTSF